MIDVGLMEYRYPGIIIKHTSYLLESVTLLVCDMIFQFL